ncbi:MAG: bifunctional (p)ppGpp synthetase/guanosine-3',5'-bis(diphosphate) 3'-pyrophosphohydrolase [Clostridia bacterium]|nr:bifunctional (p)ppGpp synthetase/guanosine-3',5'-bis(diphosphate) 3'-pyrophosphohydrolase [Clostridia bacterium]
MEKLKNKTEEMLYKELIEKVKKYHDTADFKMIEKAYELAKEAHKDQNRRSGEPFIIHPLGVAILLADIELDTESIVGGILHDVIEDTHYTREDIIEAFNEEVANIVDGVSKLGKIAYEKKYDKEDAQTETYRKMFLAMAKDIRVILIKLADRLHNMRTLEYMSEEKQKKKAQETIDIYAPLAHRLGISKIKDELEDLSFRYLKPDVYQDLKQKISKKKSDRTEHVEKIIKDLEEKLDSIGVSGYNIKGRSKHFFSIYRKMVSKGKNLDSIYDLFAVRAVVESVKDCYAVLGAIHEMYKPMPGRFKDYIAMPKPNMYQSLHTTVIGPEGEPFEMQIRTYDMHKVSEYGIAAHWKYKETGGSQETQTETLEEKLTWLRQILEWQKDLDDNKDFMNAIKTDLDVFTDEVYIFSPQGDVISLKKGSTPIDFAYEIHSAVGNKMVGAKVSGKIVKLDYELQNGDRVEIITSQNSKGPSRDWLDIVKTSQAKNKINQWFKKQFKEENILKGKELIEKNIKQKGYTNEDLLVNEWISLVTKKFGFTDWDVLCAAVGHGGLKEGQIVNRFIEEYKKMEDKNKSVSLEEMLEKNKVSASAEKIKRKANKSGIMVKGIEDVAVRFSKCCGPLPGDEIVGFITRGRGVSVHRTDCLNVIHMHEDEQDRLIDVEWELSVLENNATSYKASVEVLASDRVDLVYDLTKTINELRVLIREFSAKSYGNSKAIVYIVLEIKSKDELEKVIYKLKGMDGIDDVIRSNQ